MTRGKDAVLRSGGIFYCEVPIENGFLCGYNVLTREKTTTGDNTTMGAASIIEGYSSIGSNENIQSRGFLSTRTEIDDNVFIGPGAVLTDDWYPPIGKSELIRPILEDKAVIGAKGVILPGIRIRKGAAVAASAVMTRDVPAGKMVISNPGKIWHMPRKMMK